MVDKTPDVSAPRPGDIPKGTKIGRYRVERVVGRGGMGTVYRAFDEDTKRNVAIKMLKPDLPEELRARFLAECEAEAKIRHPHVMPVYDRGTYEDGSLYFVMELVYEPITLSEVVDSNLKGQLPKEWPRLRHWASHQRLAQDILIPICEGVGVANEEFGIMHRDLKPDNVLIDVRTRRPYLIDFGICHRLDDPVLEKKLIGTPRFLSPEQARGRLDKRTDVWGLGALLFYMFTGRPPIDSFSPMRQEERAERIRELGEQADEARAKGDENRAAELAARRAALEDPSLRTVDDMVRDAREGGYGPLPDHVPAAPRAIVAKAMAVDPEDRYASAAEMVEDLRAWVAGDRVQALSEQHATGAAVQAAQRTVRRHVTTALWVVLGLALGLPLGAMFLGGEDKGTVVRVEDALADVDALGAEVSDLAAMPPDSAAGAVQWRLLRDRLERTRARVAVLEEGAPRDRALSQLDSYIARTSEPVLVLDGRGSRKWHVNSVLGGDPRALRGTRTPLPPGPYWIESARVRIPVLLPLKVLADGEAPPEVVLPTGAVPGKIPEGMIWVPGSTSEPETPGFLMGFAEVTYVEYAEWLDDLEDDERRERLPTNGFEEDPTSPGRYLIDPDYEDRAILGIRPEDAVAFAAWRTEAFGASVRLPTEKEWLHAAGHAHLDAAYAPFFQLLEVEGKGRFIPDRSPFGVQGLLSTPAELVTTKNGYALKADGSGYGIPPSAAALEAGRVVDGGQRVEASFRLVQTGR